MQFYLMPSLEQILAVVQVVPCLVAAVLAHPGTNHKFFLRVMAPNCFQLSGHLEAGILLARHVKQLSLVFSSKKPACETAAVRLIKCTAVATPLASLYGAAAASQCVR